ncbi:MAG: Holliday junction branch migration protein RuvA [Bacillota bacterium]
MIGKLRGRVDMITEDRAIIDVGGVGYLVHLAGRSAEGVRAGEDEVSLHIHTHVREDTMELYGFTRRRDLEVFEMLIAVSGIGPRLALAVLNTLEAEDFVSAVGTGDVAVLTQVSGVGRKTAERMVLELQDRVDRIDLMPRDRRAGYGGEADEAVDALEALGYPRARVVRAVRLALGEMSSGAPGVQELVRRGLSILSDEGGVS